MVMKKSDIQDEIMNKKVDAYQHYFGVAKQMLDKSYDKDIIDALNKNKEEKNKE